MINLGPICKSLAILSGICLAMSVETASSIDIQFDFSKDTTDFFGAGNADGKGAEALAALNAAAGFFEGILDDDLDPIVEYGSYTWSATFTNPSTGGADSSAGLAVSADTMIIYVGSRDLGGTTLGEAGPGGFSASGDTTWFNAIRQRGEGTTVGSTATDFAPWGGSLAIDYDGSSNWHYDHLSAPTGKDDLYSVLLHELGHVLGVGTADSWDNLVSGSSFTGSASFASNDGSQPGIAPGGGHWADGTESVIYGTIDLQDTAFDPSIVEGTRKLITDLDVAGLDDLGWDIAAAVPEPSSSSLLAGALATLLLGRRRRNC